MPTEKQIIDLANTFSSSDKEKTVAEFLAEALRGKYVEIYLGDAYEEISTEQVSTAALAVICGRVITAYKECLVLSAATVDRKLKKLKLGNMLFINERAIRFLTEVNDDGILKDMYLKSEDTLDIKSFAGL
jgi:hypothetical protein